MGLIGRLLSFVRSESHSAAVSESKIDSGGGMNHTLQHFSDPGDDSHPLPNDYVAGLAVRPRGRHAAVGYLDPLNESKAGAGEKRIYARDAAGAAVVELFLRNDGSARLENSEGYIELEAGGDVVINGFRIAIDGTATSPTQIISPLMTVDGKELKDHIHNGVQAGASNTGPNQ